MNALLEKLLKENPEFKVSLSITGTFIEQAEQWAPDVLESFQRLVKTGQVELLAETYHHSLAFFYSQAEFERQVDLHTEKIQALFGIANRQSFVTQNSHTTMSLPNGRTAKATGALSPKVGIQCLIGGVQTLFINQKVRKISRFF